MTASWATSTRRRGEVAGVGRLEGRVRQAFARSVRRDEVLEHAETLAEVRGDRRLDDLARGLGHESAHGGELANLLRGTTRSRVGHDVDGVEARLDRLLAGLRIGDRLFADAAHHLARDRVGHACPDVDDLVVPLAVGDEPLLVLLDDLLDLVLRLVEEHLLGGRDDHVIHADGNAGAHGVIEAERAEPVCEEDGLLVAVDAVADVDEAREGLLVERLVDVLEGDSLGKNLGDEDAADGRVHQTALGMTVLGHHAVALFVEHGDANADVRVERDLAVVVGHPHFVDRGIDAAEVAGEALPCRPSACRRGTSPWRTCALGWRSRARGRCPGSG